MAGSTAPIGGQMCSQAPTWHLHPFLPISVPGVGDGGHLAMHSTGDVVQGEGPALITDLRPSVLLSGRDTTLHPAIPSYREDAPCYGPGAAGHPGIPGDQAWLPH